MSPEISKMQASKTLPPKKRCLKPRFRRMTGALLVAGAVLVLALPAPALAQDLQAGLDELADRIAAALLATPATETPAAETPDAAQATVPPPVIDATPVSEVVAPAVAAPEAAAPPSAPPETEAAAADGGAAEAETAEAVADATEPAEADATAGTEAVTPPDAATEEPAADAGAIAGTVAAEETAATGEADAETPVEAANTPAAAETVASAVAETPAEPAAQDAATESPDTASAGATVSDAPQVESVTLASEAPTPDGALLLAIADFQNLQGDVCNLGRFAAERMVTALAPREGLRVLPRRRLREVLRGAGLSSPDLQTVEELERLGQALPAHALLMGAITDLGPTLELDVRVIALQDGGTRFAGFAGFNKTVNLNTLREAECTPVMADGPDTVADAEGLAADATATNEAVLAEVPPPAPLPAFETPDYRLVVEKVTQLDDSVTLLVTLENRTLDVLGLSFRNNSYLLDENGDRWNQMFPDTARLWAWGDDFRVVELLPDIKRRTKLRYQAVAGARGQVFSLIGEEYRPVSGRVVTLPDIALTTAAPSQASAMLSPGNRGNQTP